MLQKNHVAHTVRRYRGMFPLFKDLLIHGEGGDGGAGAAPGAEAPGAEAAGVTVPDAGEQRQNRRPNKAERRAALEAKLAAERAAAHPQQSAQPQQQKTSWEEVKKQYHDEYGKDIQNAIQGRFKNQADNAQELSTAKAELEKQSKLLAQLAESQYGIKPGEDGKVDLAAIEKHLNKSRAEDYAIENGVSEEFAEERLQMEDRLKEQDRQLREFEEAEKKRQQDAAQFAMFQQHRQQAEAFREKVPGFDLVKEMESNPTFAKLIASGFPVETSYYAAHHEELMAVGQQAAAVQAQRALSANIQAGQSMPTEGGLGRSPAASPQRVTNPRQWTKAQRAEIRRRVQRGEEIYL